MSSAHTVAPTAGQEGQLVRNWTMFGRQLRRSGIPVTVEQITALLGALPLIDLRRRTEVRDAARAMLVVRRSQHATFDRMFDLFWRAELADGSTDRAETRRRRSSRSRRGGRIDDASATLDATPRVEKQLTYSEKERLRHQDFATLDASERAAILGWLRDRPFVLRPRRIRRTRVVAQGGTLDLRRTVAASRRTAGEPLRLIARQPRTVPRPLVVLCDISGSMASYVRLLLQLLVSLRTAGQRREAFVFGTRLTRITRELDRRDIDSALARTSHKVVDWGGGTRIGESLRRFNLDWGRRVLTQGAVVTVISDGWDRGDLSVLDREVGRLARTCTRLIWLNPLLGSPGYEPLTGGIRTVLRHVDDFLPVHNLHSLEQLGRHLATLTHRPRPMHPRTGGLSRA